MYGYVEKVRKDEEEVVEEMRVGDRGKVLGGNMGVVLYDVRRV